MYSFSYFKVKLIRLYVLFFSTCETVISYQVDQFNTGNRTKQVSVYFKKKVLIYMEGGDSSVHEVIRPTGDIGCQKWW